MQAKQTFHYQAPDSVALGASGGRNQAMGCQQIMQVFGEITVREPHVLYLKY